MKLSPRAARAGVYFLVALAAILSPTAARAQGVSERVDAYVRGRMAERQIPGLAVAVVRGGRAVKLKGYGTASVEFDVAADENTVFQMFSVSKVFAGLAAMKLVEDGRLSLDAPVSGFFENAPPAWAPLRVRHLLTHTSGLQSWSANPRFASLPDEKRNDLTKAEVVALVSELPLRFAPGERWAYHLSGYVMLGRVVERLSGKTYAEFLSERVFAPLQMSSTRFGGTGVLVKRRSPTAYNRQTGELRPWLYPFGEKDYPAAGLNSSAADLAKFFVALDAGKILKPESLGALWSPVKLNDGTEKGYGLGWTVGEHKGRRVVGHEGGGAAWIAHFPSERLSVAVLCNLNGARADEIQYGIADLYLDEAAKRAPKK